jgi:hypothetical protein
MALLLGRLTPYCLHPAALSSREWLPLSQLRPIVCRELPKGAVELAHCSVALPLEFSTSLHVGREYSGPL